VLRLSVCVCACVCVCVCVCVNVQPSWTNGLYNSVIQCNILRYLSYTRIPDDGPVWPKNAVEFT
jgi:hypothetical protein